MAAKFRQDEGCRVLDGLIDQAESNGCSALFLSSEDFCKLRPGQLARTLQRIPANDVRLVFTLGPIIRRLHSLWHEQVKHGSGKSLADSLASLINTPSLAPDLVERFVLRVPQVSTFVVISDSQYPDMLWKNFEQAVGFTLDVPAAERRVLNKSFHSMESDMLRVLNTHWLTNDLDPARRWRATQLIFTLFESPEWRQLLNDDPRTLPADWRKLVRNLTASTIRSLRRLQSRGRIQIIGNLQQLAAQPFVNPLNFVRDSRALKE